MNERSNSVQEAASDEPGAVVFRGDGEPSSPEVMIERLREIQAAHGIEKDSYSLGGAVAELESRLAAELGKEAAVFMPTGTLANHMAIRQLCGDKRRAIVQEQSHLYIDSGDCVPVLSGINLVPLAPGRACFTASELEEALKSAGAGRVDTPVGAVMVESPVRRQKGRVVPLEEMRHITSTAKEHGVRTHLDGARLYMMAAATGTPASEYAGLFDTVYVSLYKYFGAPFGGMLAGTAEFCEGLFHVRRMFGGGLSQAWLAAALALRGLDGFEGRFAEAMAHSRAVFAKLGELTGIRVREIEHGSNIFPLELDPEVDVARFVEALAGRGVLVFPDEETGETNLTVNTTVLRKGRVEICEAFEYALNAAMVATVR